MMRTWSINKETAVVRSVAVKKTTKGAALRNMRRLTKLFEISGNYEEITRPQLQVVKLAAPFVGTACNQMPFEASSYVDLTLTMQTAAGPVKVPGKRRCYVVNDGDEFLVSDDTLKTIGIDIDRLLEQVARLQVDEDGDDLEEVAR
ncbi:hypothetical protein DYB28_007046 [Aphanomyces astaci]|uniref:Uncharacterized protein n=1 Tax=Aphanomyces astaci TaxID=112090 RepID=A0A9X8DUP8_APHAT|nr:hypothetical protein DYB28_007046 [Aphanomyces astaci]